MTNGTQGGHLMHLVFRFLDLVMPDTPISGIQVVDTTTGNPVEGGTFIVIGLLTIVVFFVGFFVVKKIRDIKKAASLDE